MVFIAFDCVVFGHVTDKHAEEVADGIHGFYYMLDCIVFERVAFKFAGSSPDRARCQFHAGILCHDGMCGDVSAGASWIGIGFADDLGIGQF